MTQHIQVTSNGGDPIRSFFEGCTNSNGVVQANLAAPQPPLSPCATLALRSIEGRVVGAPKRLPAPTPVGRPRGPHRDVPLCARHEARSGAPMCATCTDGDCTFARHNVETSPRISYGGFNARRQRVLAWVYCLLLHAHKALDHPHGHILFAFLPVTTAPPLSECAHERTAWVPQAQGYQGFRQFDLGAPDALALTTHSPLPRLTCPLSPSRRPPALPPCLLSGLAAGRLCAALLGFVARPAARDRRRRKGSRTR